MNAPGLKYVVVTPARNELGNLRRLAESLISQTLKPALWLIVDNGSTDGTVELADELSESEPWISVISAEGGTKTARGGAVVRAFHAGLDVLDLHLYDVVVKVDADVSMEATYFEELIQAFASDPSLGMASGVAHELEDGEWTPLHMTRTSVWGACRAYRVACLEDVLPLEEHMGWDGIDEFKANLNGWSTRTVKDLPFHHHRKEGERDGGRLRVWAIEGEAAHYMGYRFSYLVIRTLFRARREPAALAMVPAFCWSVARRASQCSDRDAVTYLREHQRMRELRKRRSEALGRAL